MARRPGKKYSQRSVQQQKRIDRIIARENLDRRKALRALRDGRWKPFARTPERRQPPESVRRPQDIIGDQFPDNLDTIRERAYQHFRNELGDDHKYNDRTVRRNSEHWTREHAGLILTARETDLRDYARFQAPELAPAGWGWWIGNTWHNAFWYH